MPNPIYVLPVGETLGKAWDKVYGAKSTFWGALGLIFLIALAFGIVGGLLHLASPVISATVIIIGQVFIYFLNIGMLYLGIERASDRPVAYQDIFRGLQLPIVLRIVGVILLISIIFFVLGMILTIPAAFLSRLEPSTSIKILMTINYIIASVIIFYLAIRLSLCSMFVLDQLANPWEALKLSYQATQFNFWSLVMIFIIQIIIVAVSALPLGIGLIWTLPFIYILYGLIYKNLLVNLQQ